MGHTARTGIPRAARTLGLTGRYGLISIKL
jgi:hypothetical protein